MFGSNVLEMLPYVIPVVTKCDPKAEDGNDLDIMKSSMLKALEKLEDDKIQTDKSIKMQSIRDKMYHSKNKRVM